MDLFMIVCHPRDKGSHHPAFEIGKGGEEGEGWGVNGMEYFCNKLFPINSVKYGFSGPTIASSR